MPADPIAELATKLLHETDMLPRSIAVQALARALAQTIEGERMQADREHLSWEAILSLVKASK